MNNPAVGASLTKAYWEAGNSEMFLDLVKGLTGTPLTCDAWVHHLEEDIEAKIAQEQVDYAWAVSQPTPGSSDSAVSLDMRMQVMDGDQVLADSESDGGFLQACTRFEEFVKTKTAKL